MTSGDMSPEERLRRAHGGDVTVGDRDDGANGASFRIRIAFAEDVGAAASS